jgi:hypothetical protein
MSCLNRKKHIIKEQIAVISSMNGYTQEIFFLQLLHLPRRKRKLITGIFSQGFIALPHDGQ